MTQVGFPAANLIAGECVAIPGEQIVSVNPANPSEVLWSGATRLEHVDHAMQSARQSLSAWQKMGFEGRVRVLRKFQELARARVDEIASIICDETGKVMWESKQEAGLLASKVDITLDDSANSGMGRVRPFDFSLSESRQGRCTFAPHGVMSVVGPFNFPAHLPNGHIIPALAMGNTIVLKPSDKAPAVGQLLGSLFVEALRAQGAPVGVVNVVQGGADIANAVVSHDEVDGILFTGSWSVGRKILEANLDHPGRIIALEMGGNNAAVVMPDADLKQAAIEIVRCAFNTAGQRCTCTRRAIIHSDIADTLIPLILKSASTLIIGHPRAEYPVFMGPVISQQSRDAVAVAQEQMIGAGGRVLLQSTPVETPSAGYFVSPSIVQVESFVRTDEGGFAANACADMEVFGPLLRISVVDTFEDALEQARATRYGLSASIFTKDESLIERFCLEVRAGCVNVNTGTAGASSKLPFGGLGLSGNHRPAAAFSLDYCAYPIASMIERGTGSVLAPGMQFEDSWID